MLAIAPVQPAAYLQNLTTHTAATYRAAIAAGIGAGLTPAGSTSFVGGVHPALGNRLAVTGTAGLNVAVDTGMVVMGASTAWGGVYTGVNTASYTVAIAAVSTTQWRTDLIVARQHDTANGDGDDNWDIVPVTGTFASSSPGATPTAPNNSVPLALIRVVPNMTVTNGVGTVVDFRNYLNLGGQLYTTSSNRPPLTAPEGTEWYETDTHMGGQIVNGAYAYQYNIPGAAALSDTWHALPVLQNSWTLITGLPISGYRKCPWDPTLVQFQAAVQAGTRADGTTLLTLPGGYAAVGNYQRIDCSCDITGWTTPRTDGADAFLRFDTSGNAVLYGLPNGAGPLYCNGFFRVL